jgi:hypothetical protein
MIVFFLTGVVLLAAQSGQSIAQAAVGTQAVSSSEQLAQLMRDGAQSISIASNITGIVDEQVALGASVYSLSRYPTFPEVRLLADSRLILKTALKH